MCCVCDENTRHMYLLVLCPFLFDWIRSSGRGPRHALSCPSPGMEHILRVGEWIPLNVGQRLWICVGDPIDFAPLINEYRATGKTEQCVRACVPLCLCACLLLSVPLRIPLFYVPFSKPRPCISHQTFIVVFPSLSLSH